MSAPPVKSPPTEPLRAQGLRVRLGGRAVVDAVEIAFRPGEVAAVVGPNGAGKSTLLTCLAGLRRPDAGEVRLGPTPLAALRARERARRIGFLPQTPEIAWRLDVETLVGLGRTPHAGRFGPAPGIATPSPARSGRRGWRGSRGATCPACRGASAGGC